MVVERKSLDDLIGCITKERDRFIRELTRIRAFPNRLVIVEADWTDLVYGIYRSRLEPKSATHSVISWIGRYGVPFQFVGTHKNAEGFVSYYLFSTARRILDRLDKTLQKLTDRKMVSEL